MDIQSSCDVQFLVEDRFEGVFPPPVPAVKAFPEFFKNLSPFLDDADPQSSTAKRCLPFVDAMSFGFIIPLWADLQVRAEGGDITAEFPQHMPMSSSISGHPERQLAGHPFSDSPLSSSAFKLHNPWTINTPDGWSCLFVPPINHFERRFQAISGSVDTDNYYNEINFPMIWTGGEGNFLIKRGTPFIQVIPYYRGAHSMSIGLTDERRRNKTTSVLGTYAKDAYRLNFWHRGKTAADVDVGDVS